MRPFDDRRVATRYKGGDNDRFARVFWRKAAGDLVFVRCVAPVIVTDCAAILGATVSVYAQLGETKAALDLLGSCAAMPNGPSLGSLKLDQEWDPLRSDARFDKIVASLAPDKAK